MTLEEAIILEKFIITCELPPPKGTDASMVKDLSIKLKNIVDAINLTDGQGANMRMCPLACASVLINEGVDVIWQATCRDKNRIALQADCLGASLLGVKNVLPLKGDDPKVGDHPEAKAVFDLDTNDFIKVINGLNKGFDMSGKELKGKTNFLIGCTAHPSAPDLIKQLENIKLRFEYGSSFIQTQISYDLEQIKRFLDSMGNYAKKTLLGVTPIRSIKMAKFMHEKVFGINVPEQTMTRLEKFSDPEDQRKEGLDISREMVSELKKTNLGGIHVMAVGQEKSLPEIIPFLIS